MAKWDPDARLEDLAKELAVSDGDQEQAALRVFQENLALAAQAITHIALYGGAERVRLEAAKYVVERNLGRLQDVDPQSATDPWDALLKEVVKHDG
jgi:hypothetical protein